MPRGAVEQEYKAPGAPSIIRICRGYCGVVYVEWTAPPSSSSTGKPDQYAVLYDTVSGTGFANVQYVGDVLHAYVTLPDPSATYYFAVEAINSYGAAISSTDGPYSVANATKPSPPSSVVATSGAGDGTIKLDWDAPTGSASGAISCSFGSAPADLPSTEIKGWRVFRRSEFETTWPATAIVDESATGVDAPHWNVLTGKVTWTDRHAASCVTYTYAIQTIDRCTKAPENVSDDATDGLSAYSGTVATTTNSAVAPLAPGAPTVVGAIVGSNYKITLDWPAVSQDTSLPPRGIVVARYLAERTQYKAGVLPATYAVKSETAIDPSTATFTPSVIPSRVKWVDTQPTTAPDGAAYYYEYTIRALQCWPGKSGPGPMVRYPCVFGEGTITTKGGLSAETLVVGGAGTAAAPWLVSLPATLVGTASDRIGRIEAQMVVGTAAPVSLGSVTTPYQGVISANFTIPEVADGEVAAITITFLDNNGCSQSKVYYVSNVESNCCLVPVSVDSALRFVDAPSRTVYYRFHNVCAETLQVTGVRMAWNPTFSSGNPKVTIYYPSALGQGPASSPPNALSTSDGSGSVQATPAGSAVTIIPVDGAATSDDFWIRVVFSKGTISATAPPISSLCVQYFGSGSASMRTCRIDPSPSPTPDTCP